MPGEQEVRKGAAWDGCRDSAVRLPDSSRGRVAERPVVTDGHHMDANIMPCSEHTFRLLRGKIPVIEFFRFLSAVIIHTGIICPVYCIE